MLKFFLDILRITKYCLYDFFEVYCLGECLVHKRGRVTITIDILEATLIPQKKMRIMYKANLNYNRFNKYFHDFLAKGFIEKVLDSDGKACYCISQRGKTLLGVLKKANELALTNEI